MIAYVAQSLCGRTELWVVRFAGPRIDGGESAYRALFSVTGGEAPGPVSRCELGRTPLNANRQIDRVTAAALHPELVRRAEAEWATLDELDQFDPKLNIKDVGELLTAEGGEA